MSLSNNSIVLNNIIINNVKNNLIEDKILNKISSIFAYNSNKNIIAKLFLNIILNILNYGKNYNININLFGFKTYSVKKKKYNIKKLFNIFKKKKLLNFGASGQVFNLGNKVIKKQEIKRKYYSYSIQSIFIEIFIQIYINIFINNIIPDIHNVLIYRSNNNIIESIDITMDKINGQNLKYIIRNTNNNISFYKNIFNDLCNKLYILQNKFKFIHGDLNTKNIMIANNILYIIDLGSSIIKINDKILSNNYDILMDMDLYINLKAFDLIFLFYLIKNNIEADIKNLINYNLKEIVNNYYEKYNIFDIKKLYKAVNYDDSLFNLILIYFIKIILTNNTNNTNNIYNYGNIKFIKNNNNIVLYVFDINPIEVLINYDNITYYFPENFYKYI